MATKTGNKWSTAKCGLCDQAHYRYSGKLDVKGIEYVTCGQTRKRMNVTGKDYEKTRAIVTGKTQSFPTEWVKEQRYVDYVSEHLAVLGEHDHQLFKQIWNGLVTQGWRLDSESKTSVRLSKDGVAIKVFRNADRPEMIMVRFTAPPEEE